MERGSLWVRAYVLFLAVVLIAVLAVLMHCGPASAYDDPIVIQYDTDGLILGYPYDFEDTAEERGWVGNGTAEEPYIIEDLVIKANESTGIDIRNTESHFIIRNCTILGSSKAYGGILLWSVENGVIHGVDVNDTDIGIFVRANSYNVTISSCNAFDNNRGIEVLASTSITIDGGAVTDNLLEGIVLDHTTTSNINDIDSVGNGIGISLDVGSGGNSLSWCDVLDNAIGIQLAGSSENTISSATISGSQTYNLWLSNVSNDNTLVGCTLLDSVVGVYIDSSRLYVWLPEMVALEMVFSLDPASWMPGVVMVMWNRV